MIWLRTRLDKTATLLTNKVICIDVGRCYRRSLHPEHIKLKGFHLLFKKGFFLLVQFASSFVIPKIDILTAMTLTPCCLIFS